MILGELFIRPNGKLYVPRKGIRVCPWENWDDERRGVVVLGTHDVDRARKIAFYSIYNERWYPRHHLPGWWRVGYCGVRKDEPAWVVDNERGAPGVMFEYDEEKPTDWPPGLVFTHDD